MFYTAYGKHPEKVYNEVGTEYENNYQLEINDTGHKKLVKVGVTNVYAKIQEDLEMTKIENILHAVAMGDLRALQQREMTYCDTTSMPKTLMEAQNIVLKAKQEFNNLPVEIRKEFDNSPDVYIAQMGTKEFMDKMAPFNEKLADIKKAGDVKKYNKMVAEQAKFEKDVAAAKGDNA